MVPSHLILQAALDQYLHGQGELCFMREDVSLLHSAITLHSNYFKVFEIYRIFFKIAPFPLCFPLSHPKF